MQTTRMNLNINQAIGFPALQRGDTPNKVARCFAAELASCCGVHISVTYVYYTLITLPHKLPFRNNSLHSQRSSVDI